MLSCYAAVTCQLDGRATAIGSAQRQLRIAHRRGVALPIDGAYRSRPVPRHCSSFVRPGAHIVGILAVGVGCQSSGPSQADGGPVDGATVQDSTVEGSMDAGSDNAAPLDAMSDGGDASWDLDAACGVGALGEALDLRCAGLYDDWSTKTVSAEFKVFGPGVVLWSDSAVKTRWVSLPPGTQIDTSDMDEWTFPVNTKFFQGISSSRSGDSSTPIRIETRLLWKLAPGTWYRMMVAGPPMARPARRSSRVANMNADGNGYEVPNQLECSSCHQGRLDNILGFEALALSVPRSDRVDDERARRRRPLDGASPEAGALPSLATPSTRPRWGGCT